MLERRICAALLNMNLSLLSQILLKAYVKRAHAKTEAFARQSQLVLATSAPASLVLGAVNAKEVRVGDIVYILEYNHHNMLAVAFVLTT